MFYSKTTFRRFWLGGFRHETSKFRVEGLGSTGQVGEHQQAQQRRGRSSLLETNRGFLVFHFRSGCFICVSMSLSYILNGGPNVIFWGVSTGLGQKVEAE